MKIFILFILGILFVNGIAAQRMETSEYLYWQEGIKLEYADFKNTDDIAPGNTPMKYNVRIPVVLEYPKAINNNWYIAPAFDKLFSVFPNPNEEDLQLAQLYFDIAEYCTRVARKRIELLQTKNTDKNFDVALFYTKDLGIELSDLGKQRIEESIAEGSAAVVIFEDIIELMYMQREQLGMELYFDVNIESKDSTINRWQKRIADLLKAEKQYATGKNECERFINAKALNADYKVVYERW